MKGSILCLLISLYVSMINAQSITTSLPDSINPNRQYLFYLHGGIVQEYGPEAVSKYYGPYQYFAILDTLASYGYHVISEVRPKGTVEIEYARKVSAQVDSLLTFGVKEQQIIIVGASLGAYITLEVAHILKNQNLNYVVIGLCSAYALEYFSKYKDLLCGNFLSIYEQTDEKQSCNAILENPNCKKGYREVMVHMGIGHGFLYKPYPQWVLPVVKWIEKQ